MDKTRVRHQLLKNRQAFAGQARSAAEKILAAHVLNVLKKRNLRRVGTYISIRGEPDLSVLYDMARVAEFPIEWALPVCTDQDCLIFAQWKPGEPMTCGRYRIPVPLYVHPVPVPDALLIPCVGFHSKGFRLGYGGGWFDRTLASMPDTACIQTIGIAFDAQQSDVWTPLPHDRPLDTVITESRMYNF